MLWVGSPQDVADAVGGDGCTMWAPAGTTSGGVAAVVCAAGTLSQAARVTAATTSAASRANRWRGAGEGCIDAYWYSAIRGRNPMMMSAAAADRENADAPEQAVQVRRRSRHGVVVGPLGCADGRRDGGIEPG